MHSGTNSLRIVPSDTDSAAEDGSDMCKAGFLGAPRAVTLGSGMCKPGSVDDGPRRVVLYGSGTCKAASAHGDASRAVDDGSGMCMAGVAGLADDPRAGGDDQGSDRTGGYLNSGGYDKCCDDSDGYDSGGYTSGGNDIRCGNSDAYGNLCDSSGKYDHTAA